MLDMPSKQDGTPPRGEDHLQDRESELATHDPNALERAGGAELRLEAVSRRYGALLAVSDLSLTVGRGEFLTLLGGSGSGKTTTLNLLAGFDHPSSGRILLNGRDVSQLPPHRRGMGVVFQNYALFPHMTVAGNVAFPLKMRGIPRADIAKKVDWALSLVRLGGFQDRRLQTLSGGQQQRIALARAIIFNPSALLMDEPLAALDRSLREELQEELRDIHQKLRTTIVYVTHDQEEAMRLSDRIAVLRAGVIEQLDRPRTIYEQPANRYVATFLGKSNLFKGIVSEARDGSYTIQDQHGTFRAACRSRFNIGDAVTIAVRPEQIGFIREGRRFENRAMGRIEKKTELGADVQWEISAWDRRLLFRTNSRDRIADPHVGDTIEVGWSEADIAGMFLEECGKSG